MVWILGISAYYHDSAATLLHNGEIIAAAQEERFSRKKFDSSFPGKAINYVLEEAGIRIEDVDIVAFYDKPFLKFERLLETYHAFAPRGLRSFLEAIPIWVKEKMFMKKFIKQELNNLGDWQRNLLFPESGDDVPFSVTTVAYRDEAGHEVMTTRREFEFESTRRRFDSLTVWDADAGRLLDFLGLGGPIVSELHPRVEDGALVVEGGRQWLRVRGRYLPMPGPLAATVEVRDRYEETDESYHVDAVVETVAGEVLSYRGAFTQEREPMDEVPADLRPTRGLWTLPPE
mgnify:CR=1 FL=1